VPHACTPKNNYKILIITPVFVFLESMHVQCVGGYCNN
jgi:hypothetical protein